MMTLNLLRELSTLVEHAVGAPRGDATPCPGGRRMAPYPRMTAQDRDAIRAIDRMERRLSGIHRDASHRADARSVPACGTHAPTCVELVGSLATAADLSLRIAVRLQR